MKIGLEKEFFVLNLVESPNNPIVCPTSLTPDECGLLAEARGKAFENPVEAVFSLKADIHRLFRTAAGLGLTLRENPTMVIPKNVKIQAARTFAKGLTKYENLYGYQSHKNRGNEQTAGIHISFTKPANFIHEKGVFTYNSMFDWVKIFRQLDKAFSTEIKAARRLPGFYELKTDGRIEYRSLPANASLDKIINVLEEILFNR